MAIEAYQDKHGYLPPATVRGSDGQPLYSWRVLVLPHVGEEDLYRHFRLDEPWDSAYNKKLLARMPQVFAPPRIDDLVVEPFTTFYQAATGPGTAFEERSTLRSPDDFPDGIANTLLLAEALEAVPWTKPADLLYVPDGPLPALGGIFQSDGRFSLFGSNRLKGFNIARADSAAFFVRGEASDSVMRPAFTRNGGEPPSLD